MISRTRRLDTKNKVLGLEFLDEVRRSLQQVAEQPELYPPMHRKTRRVLTHRFPFGMFYRVAAGFIVVVSVMHGAKCLIYFRNWPIDSCAQSPDDSVTAPVLEQNCS